MKKIVITILIFIIMILVSLNVLAKDETQTSIGVTEIINTILVDARIVYQETKEDLINNNGANIGTDYDLREANDEGIRYYTKPEQWPNLPFAKKLYDYNVDENSTSQAIYIKFKPSSSKHICLSLSGYSNTDIQLMTDDNGSLYISIPRYNYYEGLTEMNFLIEDNKWYHALMAVDTEGLLQGAIWEDSNTNLLQQFNINITESFNDTEYKNQFWEASIAFSTDSELTIETYAYYTFGDFNTTGRIIETIQNGLLVRNYEFIDQFEMDYLNQLSPLLGGGIISEETNPQLAIVNGVLKCYYPPNLMEGVTRYGIGVYSFPIEDKENFWIHIRIKPYKPIPDLNYYRFVLNHSGTIMYWGERPMMFQVNTGIDEKAYMFFHNGPIFSNTGNWQDIIFYVDNKGDRRIFLSRVENDTRMLLSSIKVPGYDWSLNSETAETVFQVECEFEDIARLIEQGYEVNKEDYSIDIDFIRSATGSIEDYMADYIPAYEHNSEAIAEFLGEEAIDYYKYPIFK